MSLSAPQKFSFDLDLGQAQQKTRVISDSELNALLKQAEEKGFASGMAAGKNTEANRAAAALSDAAQKIVHQTASIASASDKLQKQTLCAATDLSLSVGKKLAANLIARAPLEEIRSLISECLGSLDNIPHLVIRCHPDLAQAVEAETKSQMQTSGFTGRLIIMGEPDILLGDARLEWVDGGLVRDLTQMTDEIQRRVDSFIRTNCPGQKTQIDQATPQDDTETPQ